MRRFHNARRDDQRQRGRHSVSTARGRAQAPPLQRQNTTPPAADASNAQSLYSERRYDDQDSGTWTEREISPPGFGTKRSRDSSAHRQSAEAMPAAATAVQPSQLAQILTGILQDSSITNWEGYQAAVLSATHGLKGPHVSSVSSAAIGWRNTEVQKVQASLQSWINSVTPRIFHQPPPLPPAVSDQAEAERADALDFLSHFAALPASQRDFWLDAKIKTTSSPTVLSVLREFKINGDMKQAVDKLSPSAEVRLKQLEGVLSLRNQRIEDLEIELAEAMAKIDAQSDVSLAKSLAAATSKNSPKQTAMDKAKMASYESEIKSLTDKLAARENELRILQAAHQEALKKIPPPSDLTIVDSAEAERSNSPTQVLFSETGSSKGTKSRK